MPGKIEITHNFTGETDYVILVPHKTTAPLADVICTINGVVGQTRIVYPAAHGQESVLFEDLDTVMYFITAWRSSDGVALDEQINVLACDAKSGAQFPVTRLEYVVGRGETGDPVDNDHGLRDSRLLSKKYWVEERGTGTMLELSTSAEYLDRSDDGGGFDWIDDDKNFHDGGVYVVFVIERVDFEGGGSSTGGTDFNDVFILSEDLPYDPGTMSNKVIIADGLTVVLTLTVPNLGTLADQKFRLQTHGGAQRNLVLQLDGGDSVEYEGETLNSIILGKGEWVECLIKNNVLYVSGDKTAYQRLGETKLVRVLESNGLQLNGTVYQQTDVPRLMWWLDNKAAASDIVAEGIGSTQWSYSIVVNGDTVYPNKGNFARDDGAGTIRVPDDREMVYKALLALTGDAARISQGIGGYQHFKTSLKGVHLQLRDGSGGSSTGTLNNTGFSGQDNPASWLDNDGANGMGNADEKYVRAKAGTDTETLIKNRGLIPQIII